MFARITVITAFAVAAGIVLVAAAPGARQQELCFGAAPTITGSGEINGTDGDDVIVGSDGDDRIRAHVGNDKICSGGGADRIGGGPGNDQIDGGPGNDDIHSGAGNDVVLGGDGDDAIHCGPDDDVADGGPGTNVVETAGFEACETIKNAAPSQARRIKATLGAAQLVTTPRARRPGGSFSATVRPTAAGATLAWRLTHNRLSGPARSAHLHAGRPGKPGPVLVRLCGPCPAETIATSNVVGASARQALLTENAYVDVHTRRSPAGEIRGKVVTVRQ